MSTQNPVSVLRTSVANHLVSSTNNAQEVEAMNNLFIRPTFVADIPVTSNDGVPVPGQLFYTGHICNVDFSEKFALTAPGLNRLLHHTDDAVYDVIECWYFLSDVTPVLDLSPGIANARDFKVDDIFVDGGSAAAYSIQLELTVQLETESETYLLLRGAVPVTPAFLTALLNDDRRVVADELDLQSLLEAQHPAHADDAVEEILGVLVLDITGTFAS